MHFHTNLHVHNSYMFIFAYFSFVVYICTFHYSDSDSDESWSQYDHSYVLRKILWKPQNWRCAKKQWETERSRVLKSRQEKSVFWIYICVPEEALWGYIYCVRLLVYVREREQRERDHHGSSVHLSSQRSIWSRRIEALSQVNGWRTQSLCVCGRVHAHSPTLKGKGKSDQIHHCGWIGTPRDERMEREMEEWERRGGGQGVTGGGYLNTERERERGREAHMGEGELLYIISGRTVKRPHTCTNTHWLQWIHSSTRDHSVLSMQ